MHQQLQNEIDTDFWETEILKEAKKKKEAAAPNKPKTKKALIGNVKQNRADARRKEEQINAIKLGSDESVHESMQEEIAVTVEKGEKYEGKSRYSKYL